VQSGAQVHYSAVCLFCRRSSVEVVSDRYVICVSCGVEQLECAFFRILAYINLIENA
jgi:hypothetical protein